jgi:PAS domain S-box-containing protein
MKSRLRVLHLEDNPVDTELIQSMLAAEGIACELVRVETRADFIAALEQGGFDIIMADYSLPSFDSLSALAIVQEKGPGIPFIFVSGTIGEEFAIETLKKGATDYVLKDRLSRLVPAVERALREAKEKAERQRAEQALRESEERFRCSFEVAPIGMALVSSDFRLLKVNRSLCQILGYDEEELAGRAFMEITYPEDIEQDVRLARQVFNGEISQYRIEKRYLAKNGAIVWADLTAAVIARTNESPPLGLGMVADITERKQAEESLQQTNRRLEEALADLHAAQQHIVRQERLRALGEMASGIAHDFNNALSPVIGYSDLLLMRPELLSDAGKVKEYLETINTAARDAAKVVSRLREFYRRREDSEVLLPVNLKHLIKQSISLTQPRWKDQAQARGATIKIETDIGDVPVIAANGAELREVLINLIFNAVDAMPDGGTITIRTRVEDQRRGSRGTEEQGSELSPRLPLSLASPQVVLEVADTGTGMTEEIRQRCLEPFFTTKGEHGTGLGLAMVYGVIQRHEGTIDIESEVGKGTTFRIRFPIEKRASLEAQDEAVALARRLRILLVDDEKLVRDVVAEYLTADGHAVETARDGSEALEKFKANPFDLVITDRAMPNMSGDQLAVAIKNIAPNAPVILLTGFGELMKATSERPEGVDFVAAKPVTLVGLRQAIAEAMSSGEA